MRKKSKGKKFDFLLENSHYKKLNLLIYLSSLLIIVIIFYVTLYLFSTTIHIFTTTLISFLIGLYVVINRVKLVKKISSCLQNYNRIKYRENCKQGLHTTLKKITPKNKKLKLKIEGKVSIKERITKIKNYFESFGSKKKKKLDYIEIK